MKCFQSPDRFTSEEMLPKEQVPRGSQDELQAAKVSLGVDSFDLCLTSTGIGGLASIFIWDDGRELRNMGCSCLKIPCLSLLITWTTGMGHCTHLLCKCCRPKARPHACLPSTPSHLSAPSLIPNHISYHERTWYGGDNWRHELCSKLTYSHGFTRNDLGLER